MSWDLAVCKFEGPLPSADAVWEGVHREVPPPANVVGLGDVRAALASGWPQLEWEPGSGFVDGGDYSFQVFEEAEPFAHLMFHFHGQGNPLPVLVKVCKEQGWVVVDPTEDPVYMDLDRPSAEGLHGYHAALAAVSGMQPPKAAWRAKALVWWWPSLAAVGCFCFLPRFGFSTSGAFLTGAAVLYVGTQHLARRR